MGGWPKKSVVDALALKRGSGPFDRTARLLAGHGSPNGDGSPGEGTDRQLAVGIAGCRDDQSDGCAWGCVLGSIRDVLKGDALDIPLLGNLLSSL